MDIQSLLSPGAVIASCDAQNRRQALQSASLLAAAHTGLSERDIMQALLHRERLGSTGMGKGVALPHARFAKLQRMYGFFLRLQNPIEFEAPDGRPVDMLFVLLAPEGNPGDHLKAMARIARLLRDANSCAKLREAVTMDVLFSLLTAEDDVEAD